MEKTKKDPARTRKTENPEPQRSVSMDQIGDRGMIFSKILMRRFWKGNEIEQKSNNCKK